MDVAETENDAVATAVRDQERAGVDVISDGEMRRQGFIVSIFKYFHGLKPIEPRRKVGVLSYDGHVLYEPVERISAPDGLGTVRELQYLRQVTARPFKTTLPGPLTLATQITKGGPYRDRVEVATDLAPIINREMAGTGLWRESDCPRELGAGVLDLKNFYVESPELVARRIRRMLESVPAERLWINPDCGLARLPRHLAFAKLQALVIGTRQVRQELTGRAEPARTTGERA